MRDGWVEFGAVAHLDLDRVPVVGSSTYPIAGVLNSGQGLFGRGSLLGSETNYPVLHRLHGGQVVMRKLTAWEGPITVVPDSFDGYYVSNEFPTFTLTADSLLPPFMNLICRQAWFWEAMRDRSTGTVQRRKRVSPDQLLSITIPLPPLVEQRRIVDLIESVDGLVDATELELARIRSARSALLRSLLAPRPHWTEMTVGEGFEVRMGRQRSPKHASGPHMVPYLRAANVKDGCLVLDDILEMNFSPNEQATFRLEPGDVLVTEGCGSLNQLGASASWSGEVSGTVCFQNTLLRLRTRTGKSLPGFIKQWANLAFDSGLFSAVAAGTNIFHIGATRASELPLSLPPLEEQERISETLGAVDEVVGRAAAASTAAHSLRAALLNDLLSGDHEIPESYDRLLEQAS